MKTSPRFSWRARKLVAAVAVLSIVAAACGDDDENGATEATAAAEATDAPDETAATPTTSAAAETTEATEPTGGTEAPAGTAEGEPIKIGFALAQSGSLATTYASASDVAQAWASWVNDNGGIDGRPVEIIAKDSQGDATAGQAAVRELVEQEGVVAMLLSDTGAETVMGEYLNQQNVPVIGASGFSTSTWSVLPNHISMSTTLPTTVLAQGKAAVEVGATTFGAFVCAESPACTESKPFYEGAAQGAGLEFLSFLTVAAADTDYTAPCLALIGEGTDYMQLSIPVSVAVRVMDNCIAQGYDGHFGTAAVSFAPNDYDVVPGIKMAGILNGFPWWADAEPVQQFRDVMAEYAPDVDYANTADTSTWSALELFREAVTGASEVTRESVLPAYDALDGETLDGLLPMPLTFTEGQPAPKVPCYWMYTYESGSAPTLVAPTGDSGNGASGELATWCDEA